MIKLIVILRFLCFFVGFFAIYQSVIAMSDAGRFSEHTGAFIALFIGVLMVVFSSTKIEGM